MASRDMLCLRLPDSCRRKRSNTRGASNDLAEVYWSLDSHQFDACGKAPVSLLLVFFDSAHGEFRAEPRHLRLADLWAVHNVKPLQAIKLF